MREDRHCHARAASVVRLAVDAGARRPAEIDAELILNGPTPRLLDEWQTAPTLWNHVRRAVDDRALPGQFILTGSATPADDLRVNAQSFEATVLHYRDNTGLEVDAVVETFDGAWAAFEIKLGHARDTAHGPAATSVPSPRIAT